MKITTKFLAFMVACSGMASGASVTWQAVSDVTIADSSGTLLGSGFSASVGWFDTATYDQTNYAAVSDNFVQLGTTTFPYGGNSGYNGYFSDNVVYSNDSLAGENIFVFITDDTTEWALLEFSGDTFKADSAIPNTATASINTSNIGSWTITGGSYDSDSSTVQLAAIPEPSAALLGGLGGLLLLRRRRSRA